MERRLADSRSERHASKARLTELTRQTLPRRRAARQDISRRPRFRAGEATAAILHIITVKPRVNSRRRTPIRLYYGSAAHFEDITPRGDWRTRARRHFISHITTFINAH